jgi:hypothetical protein
MTSTLVNGNNALADTRGNAAIARANATNGVVNNALSMMGTFAGGYGGYTPYRPSNPTSTSAVPFGATNSPWGLY